MTLLILSVPPAFTACSPDNDPVNPGTEAPAPNPQPDPAPDPPAGNRLHISIGTVSFTAALEDNAAARAFKAMLPMTLGMNELNRNEKYCDLPQNLPTAASGPGSIRNGEIMLYGARTLVLFYKSFPTSYSYTRIGSVDNPAGLESALGTGSVRVAFELLQ